MLEIGWRWKRLDEGDPPEGRLSQCLVEIEGAVTVEGAKAGEVHGFYLHDEPLDSRAAFWELWDIDARTCDIFSEIHSPDRKGLREPLARWLEMDPAILCVEWIALARPFRKRGLGLEVLRETVRRCADDRVGAVLLRTDPLQYERAVRDDLDENLDWGFEELPRNGRERDETRLQFHFRTWEMQRLPRTKYMVAPPRRFCEEAAEAWPPVTVLDIWNTCVLCGELVDKEAEAWERCPEGLAHRRCLEAEPDA